jgi:phosphoglycerate dehydrogenase-like enzyme
VLEPWLADFRAALPEGTDVRVVEGRPAAGDLVGVRAVADLGAVEGDAGDLAEAAAAAGVALWQVVGTALDHFDVDSFLARGVPLASLPAELSAAAIAEHAFALMLAHAKRLRAAGAALRAGKLHEPVTAALEAKTLGLVGFGASARELARRAQAFGMDVAVSADGDLPPAAVLAELGVGLYGDGSVLDLVLEEADYLSLHVPLTPRTRRLIGADALDLMKPDAVVVSVTRAGVVDEEALLDALTAGRIGGACLDVFEHEPVSPDHPLLGLESVVATPHVAALSRETCARRAEAAAENVTRALRGEPPQDLVEAGTVPSMGRAA